MKQEYESKWLEKICPIIWFRNAEVAFGFDGYGISTKTDRDFSKYKELVIKYRGILGTVEFEYKIK